MLYAQQVRAARAMINMSQIELANITGLHYVTIQKIEKDEKRLRRVEAGTINKIKNALEERGIKFLNPTEQNSIYGIGIRYCPTEADNDS